jgi:hypothetical protein
MYKVSLHVALTDIKPKFILSVIMAVFIGCKKKTVQFLFFLKYEHVNA